MKTLEAGSTKLKKICEILTAESLEPAKKEGEAILAEATARAHQIIKDAEKKAAEIQQEVQSDIEREKNVFNSTMQQASRLVVEALKEEIEHKLFDEELHQQINNQMKDSQVIVHLLKAMITAIEKEGINSDLSAIVPHAVQAQEINALLGSEFLKKLKAGAVELGDFAGGAKIKIHDKKITIDISDKSVMELLARYASGYRKYIFAQR